MAEKRFMKGNEALAEAAVRAGMRFFAGYPITPQNEIPEYLSWRLPEVGGVFVQGESEIASINMVYGAGQTGTRSMTTSSSTGVSLYSEGVAFCASARIPIVREGSCPASSATMLDLPNRSVYGISISSSSPLTRAVVFGRSNPISGYSWIVLRMRIM